jgi:hypothetical protein
MIFFISIINSLPFAVLSEVVTTAINGIKLPKLSTSREEDTINNTRINVADFFSLGEKDSQRIV